MRLDAHIRTAGRHRCARLIALFLLSGLLIGASLPAVTRAESAPVEDSARDPHAAAITEAAERFAIPEHWIRAVIEVESAGRVHAVSSAGAMGLMQIMPDTWAELRLRHRLGDDPFDPRNNILGGTAYLRQMYDRFGAPGFLAAYNAGPTRYQQHLTAGRPLPRETMAYVATLAPMLGLAPPTDAPAIPPPPSNWREAPLFVERADTMSAANSVQHPCGFATGSTTALAHHDGRGNDLAAIASLADTVQEAGR